MRQLSEGILSLLRGDPEIVTRYAGVLIVVGAALAIASARFGTPGVIVGTFAIGLGAAGGSLVDWRHEKGLWLLAGFFLLINVAIEAMFVFFELRDLARGAPWPGVSQAIDFGFGTLLLSATVRFLWRVARFNYVISQELDRR